MFYTRRRFSASTVSRPAPGRRSAPRARSPALRLFVLGLLSLPVAAPSPAGAGEALSPKEEMRFGIEAARHGLWREAAFRFEKALKADAKNARLHNNLAVAWEGLGRIDDARRAYREASRLAPDNKEIRDNHESFEQAHEAPGTGSDGHS